MFSPRPQPLASVRQKGQGNERQTAQKHGLKMVPGATQPSVRQSKLLLLSALATSTATATAACACACGGAAKRAERTEGASHAAHAAVAAACAGAGGAGGDLVVAGGAFVVGVAVGGVGVGASVGQHGSCLFDLARVQVCFDGSLGVAAGLDKGRSRCDGGVEERSPHDPPPRTPCPCCVGGRGMGAE